MVTDCLLVRQVHWVQSTYWIAAKANGPFISHRTPLHASPLASGPVECNSVCSRLSESDLIPVEWTPCDTVCQCTSLYGQTKDSVVYRIPVHLRPDLLDVQKSSANWRSCLHAACDTWPHSAMLTNDSNVLVLREICSVNSDIVTKRFA
jgi:hypothetical protein